MASFHSSQGFMAFLRMLFHFIESFDSCDGGKDAVKHVHIGISLQLNEMNGEECGCVRSGEEGEGGGVLQSVETQYCGNLYLVLEPKKHTPKTCLWLVSIDGYFLHRGASVVGMNVSV